MYYYGIDYTYIIFVLPAIILSLIAQIAVKNSFARYSKIKSSRGITGAQAAQFLLQKNGITDVRISHISGSLTDNYNPSTKILNLSDSTYSSTSIAAIGVAAHETGHAIQHATGYKALHLRSTLVPAANIGSRFGPVLVILGIILGAYAQSAAPYSLSQLVINAGIILFGVAVLFYIITLPVEFNASRRALNILKDTGVLEGSELSGVRKVLSAAAMTYVAAALTAIGSMLRLILISRSRNSRR